MGGGGWDWREARNAQNLYAVSKTFLSKTFHLKITIGRNLDDDFTFHDDPRINGKA